MREILTRTATPTDVRFDRREIDVLAVPYDTETNIGPYRETIAPGSFGRVANRAGEIKVMRDHRPDRVVGRCASITDGNDGLRATLRVSPTPLGDETLVLANDGVLDVSVGFSSNGGDRWNSDKTAVVRTNLWLWELSLVPLPAYETAKVLAVRHSVESDMTETNAHIGRPNSESVRAWLTEMRYGPNQSHPNG